jgi:hypothetical protein
MKDKEHVIVLHGLALNSYWTAGLACSLKNAGYEVHNVSYPSRQNHFEELVESFLKPLIDDIPCKKIHFVVHSMGGILVRLYAKEYGAERIGRVVMLGTPNHGSEAADLLRRVDLLDWFFGETGRSLGTTEKDVPSRLGSVPFECGVIAGENSWFHFPTSLIAGVPKPSDGVVSVESTKVDGMKDHVTLCLDHSLMVWSPKVWELSKRFLKTGKFI